MIFAELSEAMSTTYCPDYINRRKGNKDGKLQDLIKQYGEPEKDNRNG